MRTFHWLLAVLLMTAPFALAQTGEEEDENKTGDAEHAEGSQDDEGARDEEGDDEEADEDEKDDDEDERDDDEEREVHVEIDGHEAKIKLERETNASEDQIELRFKADEGLLEVKYEAESNDTETEQRLRARFHEVFEYVDADGDGAYDPGEPISSSYRLGGETELADDANGTASWQAIQMSDVTKGNASGKKLESRATFGDGGVFGLVFYVFGEFAEVDGSSLAPTEAKIDILIQHYPYVRNDTRVGVVVSLKAQQEFESEHEFVDADEEGLAASGTTSDMSFSLVFTWKETAIVDGASTPVRSTVLKNSMKAEVDEDGSELVEKTLIVLSYARGDDILHDPTAGVSYQTASDRTSMVPGPGLALVAAAIALVALLAPRRRRG